MTNERVAERNLLADLDIVSASDLNKLESVSLLLEEVKRRVSFLQRDAEIDAARLRETGYNAGFEAGKAEYVREMIRAQKFEKNCLVRQAQKLSELVFMAVTKIVTEEIDREIVVKSALKKLLSSIEGSHRVRLLVPPGAENTAKNFVSEESISSRGVLIQVVVDNALQDGSCIIETELGRVDGSIDVQLNNLLRSISFADSPHESRE